MSCATQKAEKIGYGCGSHGPAFAQTRKSAPEPTQRIRKEISKYKRVNKIELSENSLV